MKEEEIKIRISEDLKKDFQGICEYENKSMSTKLHEFIVKEIEENKPKTIENTVTDMLAIMGFNNVTIISMPLVKIHNGKLVSYTVAEAKTMQVADYRDSLIDFVNKHRDKKIFLLLSGCDLQNKKLRAILV